MIEQSVLIPNATAQQVYDLLMDSKSHAELIADSADISPDVGGSFSVFSGYANGQNLQLVPGKLMHQSWRASDWPDGHYSEIWFRLSSVGEGTQIDFVQTNLPEGTQKEFESGWYDNYWNPMIEYFA